MNNEYYAKEAARLLSDDVLLEAIKRVRTSAIDALLRADANKISDVVRLQAKVSVCDDIMGELDTMIQVHLIDTRPRIVG